MTEELSSTVCLEHLLQCLSKHGEECMQALLETSRAKQKRDKGEKKKKRNKKVKERRKGKQEKERRQGQEGKWKEKQGKKLERIEQD